MSPTPRAVCRSSTTAGKTRSSRSRPLCLLATARSIPSASCSTMRGSATARMAAIFGSCLIQEHVSRFALSAWRTYNLHELRGRPLRGGLEGHPEGTRLSKKLFFWLTTPAGYPLGVAVVSQKKEDLGETPRGHPASPNPHPARPSSKQELVLMGRFTFL